MFWQQQEGRRGKARAHVPGASDRRATEQRRLRDGPKAAAGRSIDSDAVRRQSRVVPAPRIRRSVGKAARSAPSRCASIPGATKRASRHHVTEKLPCRAPDFSRMRLCHEPASAPPARTPPRLAPGGVGAEVPAPGSRTGGGSAGRARRSRRERHCARC